MGLRYASFNLFTLGVLFVMSACSKDEAAEISSEKIPVSTLSTVASSEYQQGLGYSNTLQIVKAESHFRLALDVDPEFAIAWLNLAFVSPGTQLFLAAMDSARKYAPQASEGEQLMIRAAKYGFEGNIILQLSTLEDLEKLYPGDEQTHLLIGNYYFGLQQYRLAIISYTKGAQINKSLAILHNQLGYSQRALGNYGEAEKAFKYALKLNSENPNAYDSYAELLMEMGRFNESIEFYALALKRDPIFVASYIGIACNYGFMGKQGKARNQLKILMGVAQNQNDTRRAIFTETLTYVNEGNLAQAINTMQSNLKIARDLKDAANMANDLVILGNLYLELNEPAKALEQFNQAILVINQSALPQAVIVNAQATHLFNISRVYALEGAIEKAQDTAELFAQQVGLRKNPVQMKLIFQLKGIISLQEGDYLAAIDELGKANHLNPYNLFRIGQAYAALGEKEQADSYKLQAEELNILNSLDQSIVLSKTRFLKNPS